MGELSEKYERLKARNAANGNTKSNGNYNTNNRNTPSHTHSKSQHRPQRPKPTKQQSAPITSPMSAPVNANPFESNPFDGNPFGDPADDDDFWGSGDVITVDHTGTSSNTNRGNTQAKTGD